MALLQRFSFILLFATLIGCGGSSGGFDETPDEGEGSTPDAITVTLTISDRSLSQATPQKLTVLVMQGNIPVSDKLVTFSVSNEDLASFSTDVNTSSTDVNGQAEIGLLVGESSGDGSITATVDGVESNSITFSSAGDSAIQDGTTLILEISARDLSQATPQTLTATMMQDGSPVSDQLITFTISNAELASFDAEFNTRSTNEMGKAEIGLLAGTSAGDGSITATVNGVSSNAITFSSAGDGGVTLVLTISGENVSQATPQTLTVLVMQGDTPVSDKLVTFSISNEDLASFSTDVNTSRTDVNGQAEIGLLVGESSGDGSITATVDGIDSNPITFSSAGDGDIQDGTTLILEISARDLSQATPQTLTATMMQGGSPVSDQLITFTISNDELASFDTEFNTSSTNEMGKAEIGLLAGTSAGDGSVTATVNGVSSNAITFSSAGDGGVTLVLTISGENVSQATPQTLTAILMEGTTPISTKLVTFSISNADLASFSTDVNTSSTNLDGEAEIGLIVGESSGDGSITASAEGVTSNSVTFKSAGDSGVIGEPVASAVSLFASSQQIASSGDDEITLISIAKDENNNLVEGVTVSFSATSGQIEVIDSVTGTDGQASAILRTNNEPTNRLITVTSSSGQVTDSVDVQVIGTSINLTGSSSLAINDENSFFIEVLDSDSVAIPNTRVELSLDPPTSGDAAVISVADSVSTDITGQANFTVTGTTGGTNTLVVSALGVVTKHEITVQADSFLFSSFNNGEGAVTPDDNKLSDVLLSDTATIELTWERSNVAVADGTNVNFTSTRGIVSPSSTTTINGKASTTITSNNAGKALVTVTGTDGGITLSNQLAFEFVAGTVAVIDAQASPNSIAANGETSTISVVVKDADGNLVKGKTIDFSLSDTSSGSILPASVVTDSNGTASTIYTSNTVSAKDGISITAKVREEPSISDTVTLTVADRNLFITLGTGNELIEIDSTTFNKQYVAFVTDVDSATPAKNTVLTVSAVPRSYYKGTWEKSLDENDEFEQWVTVVSKTCSNEDSDVDGFLGPLEDVNGDGTLTPGNVAAVLGEVTTDEQGRALIDVKYPQNYGGWINIDLIVSAKVGGTESSKQVLFTLPALLEDVLNEDSAPPQGMSPLGMSGNCTDTN